MVLNLQFVPLVSQCNCITYFVVISILNIKKQKEIKAFIKKYFRDDDIYLSLISDEGNNISFIIADTGDDDGEDAIVMKRKLLAHGMV